MSKWDKTWWRSPRLTQERAKWWAVGVGEEWNRLALASRVLGLKPPTWADLGKLITLTANGLEKIERDLNDEFTSTFFPN